MKQVYSRLPGHGPATAHGFTAPAHLASAPGMPRCGTAAPAQQPPRTASGH